MRANKFITSENNLIKYRRLILQSNKSVFIDYVVETIKSMDVGIKTIPTGSTSENLMVHVMCTHFPVKLHDATFCRRSNPLKAVSLFLAD